MFLRILSTPACYVLPGFKDAPHESRFLVCCQMSVSACSCALCPALCARVARGTCLITYIVARIIIFVKRENLTELLVCQVGFEPTSRSDSFTES